MPGAEYHSLAIFQLDYLASAITKKNYKGIVAEINQILSQSRNDLDRHLLRSLFSNIDFSPFEIKKGSKEYHQLQFLIQELQSFQSKPNFTSLICFAVQTCMNLQRWQSSKGGSTASSSHYHQLLMLIGRMLKMPCVPELVLGLALTHSTNKVLSKLSLDWFQQKLTEFSQMLAKQHSKSVAAIKEGSEREHDGEESGSLLLHEVGIEVVHFLLTHLLLTTNPYGLSDATLATFRENLRKDFPKDRVPLVLYCLLYPMEEGVGEDLPVATQAFAEPGLLASIAGSICGNRRSSDEETANVFGECRKRRRTKEEGDNDKDDDDCEADNPDVGEWEGKDVAACFVAEILEELGPGCTKSPDELRRALSELTPEDFSAAAVARCICMFMRTCQYTSSTIRFANGSSQADTGTWEVENFIFFVQALKPGLDLTQAIVGLDCPEFFVGSLSSFSILKRFLLVLQQSKKPQTKLPIDVFYQPWKNAEGQLSFLQYCQSNPDVICLAYWPFHCVSLMGYKLLDDEHDGAIVQIWKNVDYVQALLNLSERGLFAEVKELFLRSFKLAPDVFTACLMKTSSMCALKCWMLSMAFGWFILPRQNSQIILQTAWTGCQDNLTQAECEHQRSLVLAVCVQTMHSWLQTGSPLSPEFDNSFSRLIELLLGIQSSRSNGTASAPLPLILGTMTTASAAVTHLLPNGAVEGGNSGHLGPVPSSATCGNEIGTTFIIATPVSLLLDIAFVFVIYMVDAVNAVMARLAMPNSSSEPPPAPPPSITAIQSALDSFLTNWFSEQIADKDEADVFMVHLVDYLRARYPSLMDPSTSMSSMSGGIAPLLSTIENNMYLPIELRRPSPALIRHIINSARKALRSPTSCVSPAVASEAHQGLFFYLQNLNRLYNCPPTGGGGGGGTSGESSGFARSQTPTPGAESSSWTTGSTSGLRASSSANNLHQIRVGPRKQPSISPTTMAAGPIAPTSGLITLVFNNDAIELELPKELEVEVNSFFQKLLKGLRSSEEMIKTVYEYASRGSLPQKKLLDGILRMLAYEVSRHLHEYPPEDMLPLITELYGSILAGLVNFLSVPALSMLWRAFLTRLYHLPTEISVDAPLFRACVHILVKAKPTFVRYANLATCLVNFHALKLFPADLQEAILAAELFCKNYQRSQQQHQSHLSGSQSAKDLVSSSLQASDEYLPPDPPDEAVSDRIYFLFNNVSKSNAKEKSAELVEILQENILPWFAYYLVCKRVTVEHTFHDLFATVMDFIQERHPTVRPRVMYELLRNVKFILRNIRSDKDDAQTRNSLKNLGSFLGLVTLARNKPLLHDDLNIKDLLYEAYHKGPVPLHYVVPFVTRIVRGSSESLVFRPPSPWTMAIFKVLRELYDMRDVKVNVRFEIEILFKEFKYSLDDISAAEVLRDPNRLASLETQIIFMVNGNAPRPVSGMVPTTSTTIGPSSSAFQLDYDTFSDNYSRGGGSSGAAPQPPTSSQQAAQHRVLTLMDAYQRAQAHQPQSSSSSQQQQITAPPTMAALHAAVMDVGQRGSDTGYSTSSADLAAMMHSTCNRQAAIVAALQQQPGVSGNGPTTVDASNPTQFEASMMHSQRNRQAAIVAALQQQPGVGGNGASSTGASNPQQFAAALASFQQQQNRQQMMQQQQSMPSGLSHTTSTPQIMHPEPLVQGPLSTLRYEDVDVNTVRSCLNLDDIIQQLAVNGGGNQTGSSTAMAAVNLLHNEPNIRNLIQPAIEKAINELITPLFDRCSNITVPTVIMIVRKDFALEPDPTPLLTAARQMVRHLSAGISLITAREALSMSLVNNLKGIILSSIQSASVQEKEAVEWIAMSVVTKSMYACLAYIQKTVAERAIRDVEKRLEQDVKDRKELGPIRFVEKARAIQQESLPECVRMNPFIMGFSKLSVYQEFGRSIPGFASSLVPGGNGGSFQQQQSGVGANFQQSVAVQGRQLSTGSYWSLQGSTVGGGQAMGGNNGPPSLSSLITQQQLQQQSQQQAASNQQAPITDMFDKIIANIERHLTAITKWIRVPTDPILHSLHGLIEAVHMAKSNQDTEITVTIISTVVQSLLDHYQPSVWADQPRGLEVMEHLKEAHMITLREMLSCEPVSWVTRQVTQTWIQLPEIELSTNRHFSSSSGVKHLSTLAAIAIAKSAVFKPSDELLPKGDNSQEESLKGDGKRQPGCNKWNWEAFAELLKGHVVYLSQVDTYLAEKVSVGHSAATIFVLDLLDHFVLPSLSGVASSEDNATGPTSFPGFPRSSAATGTSATNTGSVEGSNAPNSALTSPSSCSGLAALADVRANFSNALNVVNSKREFTVLNEYDLWLTIKALQSHLIQLSASPSSTNDAHTLRLRLSCIRVRALLDLGLLEDLPYCSHPSGRNIMANAYGVAALYAGCSRAREFDDPPSLQGKTESLIRSWLDLYQNPHQNDAETVETIILQLRRLGVLWIDENLTRFFRLATIYVVERALKHLKLAEQNPSAPVLGCPVFSGNFSAAARVVSYVELDAYARLISIVVNHGGENTDCPNSKIGLLNKVLGIIAGTLLQEHEVRPEVFHPMPFERILVMLFSELYSQVCIPSSKSAGLVAEVQQKMSEESGMKSLNTAVTNTASSDSGSENSAITLHQYIPLAFGHLLHLLRPERATTFIFAWLEMVAHRSFVDRTLAADPATTPAPLRAAYQATYAQLLVDLLKFLSFYLQNALLPKPIHSLYTATFRLCLVLFHDFPEFVSDYCVLFCDLIPSNSLQLRNLILSAQPKRGNSSADPLQAPPVDQLAMLEDPTGYCMDAGQRLPLALRAGLDAYLTTRAPVKLLSELVTLLRRTDNVLVSLIQPLPASFSSGKTDLSTSTAETTISAMPSTEIPDTPTPVSKKAKRAAAAAAALAAKTPSKEMLTSTHPLNPSSSSSNATVAASLWSARATQQLATFGLSDGMHYNVELMMNLVLYICITAIRNLRERSMPLNMTTIAHTPQMDIIQSLVLNLDNEGRYLLLNCMANQLRYPNSHTYYFSYTILYLFSEQSKEQVKEQISRVLMERLIVNRPHPWGLLMTSAELLRNSTYRFWEHEFARCHNEMENIVTIVARSCIPNFTVPSQNTSGHRTSNSASTSSDQASKHQQSSNPALIPSK